MLGRDVMTTQDFKMFFFYLSWANFDVENGPFPHQRDVGNIACQKPLPLEIYILTRKKKKKNYRKDISL